MKRDLFIHFSFYISLFVLITVFKQVLDFSYWPFFVGGIIGTLLPDIDHIIYIYLVKPYELTSRRFSHLLGEKDLRRSVELLYETRNERKNLVFHSQFFQALFLVVTFWVMTSSGSLIGKGVALAFSLHLCVDQLVDAYELNTFIDKKEKTIWIIGFILTVLIGFV